MKISLSRNIRSLRRERRMTQEMLAEALGVTVGAVHKWETGASLPEIRLLLEMADLFGVSMDALLGYEMRANSVKSTIEGIRNHLRTKDFDAALSEAEKALIRYPNSFDVVHCCADAYERKGVETGDVEALNRAIELMERSIPLLSQNDDPQISEVTIRSDIAICHIMLRQTDKGIAILKKYNAGGINNSLLGLICSQDENYDRKETEQFLVRGLADVVTNAIRCMSGYVNYYSGRGNLAGALEAAQWLASLLESLRAADGVCYFDKIISTAQAAAAAFSLQLGRQDEARRLMNEAYSKAAAFDAAPVYNVRAMKFLIGDVENTTASDDLGETAASAIEKLLCSDENFRAALELWKQIINEHTEESDNE
ncbi:MAG: helix-turn-helix transcriptional regulator [Ruminococcaceae bacterium]|nr:helix-turn-helix transcriptional regulator [Oscillospiraceae bacterium]